MGSDRDQTSPQESDPFREFGQKLIPEVQQLILQNIPYCQAFQLFWNGSVYHFIFEEARNQRWAELHQAELEHKVQQLFAAADQPRQFPIYPVELLFGHGETVLFQNSAAAEEGGFVSWRWRLAPWLAFTIGGLWLTVTLISSRGIVRWRELYPAVSLLAAGFFVLGVNRWMRQPSRRADEPDQESSPT